MILITSVAIKKSPPFRTFKKVRQAVTVHSAVCVDIWTKHTMLLTEPYLFRYSDLSPVYSNMTFAPRKTPSQKERQPHASQLSMPQLRKNNIYLNGLQVFFTLAWNFSLYFSKSKLPEPTTTTPSS